jgi:hypothetical protein
MHLPGFTADSSLYKTRHQYQYQGQRPVVTYGDFSPAGWEDEGIYPEFITCTIAGLTTGAPHYCQWYFLFWKLRVWRD